jgi:hypothetical protein
MQISTPFFFVGAYKIAPVMRPGMFVNREGTRVI